MQNLESLTPIDELLKCPSYHICVLLDAVDHGLIVTGFTSQDRELATSATPDKLLVTDSTIVHKCSHFDIISGALSSLVIGRETPAVSLASLGYNEAVVSGGRDELAINARENCRLDKEARLLIFVEKQIILIKLG